MQVVIAWNSKKRHIFKNGQLLCKSNHSNGGYSASNGQYSSYNLDFPMHDFQGDSKYTHSDGVIPFLPLDKVEANNGQGIIRKSICKKCQKKYDALF